MDFFRVIPWDSGAGPLDATALIPARDLQGGGRHDNTDLYAALYCSPSKLSCVSETIQNFTPLLDKNLFRNGKRLHLIQFSVRRELQLVDLDNPSELVKRNLHPSAIATRKRSVTQPIARRIFDSGESGFLWWSTIESTWTNATLFFDRISADITFPAGPAPLTLQSSDIRNALLRE